MNEWFDKLNKWSLTIKQIQKLPSDLRPIMMQYLPLQDNLSLLQLAQWKITDDMSELLANYRNSLEEWLKIRNDVLSSKVSIDSIKLDWNNITELSDTNLEIWKLIPNKIDIKVRDIPDVDETLFTKINEC